MLVGVKTVRNREHRGVDRGICLVQAAAQAHHPHEADFRVCCYLGLKGDRPFCWPGGGLTSSVSFSQELEQVTLGWDAMHIKG